MSNQVGRRACTKARECGSAADVDGRGWWVMADDVVVGAVSAGGVCVRVWAMAGASGWQTCI
jgi:hypothetical protein